MPNKKNIIFPIEFDHLKGGMILSVISLVNNLSNEYNVFIIASKNAEILNLNLKCENIALENPFTVSLSSPIKTFLTYREIRRRLKKFNKNDTIVLTNNVGSELIFSGFGFFPLKFNRVFISRGGDYLGKTGFLIRKGFKTVNHFVAISNRQLNVLKGLNISDSKITMINNGIKNDAEESIRANNISKQSISKIVVVGYFNYYKNQILAVRALAKLKKLGHNLELFFYGISLNPRDRIYELSVKDEAKLRGVEEIIHYCGFEKDLTKIYTEADINLSCSLSEGFGRTIVEAMSFGVPSIGLVESGGLLDIITDGVDGLLVNNNDDDVVEAIIKLVSDNQLRNQISFNSFKTYNEKFNEKIMVTNYKLLLKNLF